MSAQAVPTDAALALVASLQTRKQGLADRLHTSLLSVLRTTAAGHVPSITLTRASKEETYFDHATQSVRLRTERQQRVLTFGKKEAFTQVICLLVSVYEGLVRDVKSTKRDLYYRNVALFKSQSVVDRLLSQLELTYECERHEFNVVASAKGLLFGPAAITMTDGQVLDLSSQARNITDVEHYAAIDLSNIETVLVVEKDAVFQTLCQSVSAAPASHPCKNWLLLTAKGYPDVSSRQALKFIEASITTSTDVSIRAIPLLCLVDLDPHGIEILATWKYGSVARAAHSRHLAVTSLRWLGVHVEEIADVAAHMLPLTPADNRKADALLCRKWCTGSMQSRNWRQQVMRLKQLQLKAEIEILAEKQDGLLSTLTNWIQYGNWL